ncbi:MAG TPA: DNA primase [Longimicrobium sp.]|nr:DNA primase [Longimicrobium sp.]
MPIPDHLVEEIRQRADIVEIVSEHTRLKRTGKTYRGPCPLHGGEGPNFSVDPAKGFFKCFVCGEGGSVYTFLQKQLGMTYPDAIRWVAARVGIDIPDPREEKREEDPNRVLYEVNQFAAEWFRKQLESDDGRRAREYLAGRGITDEVAARFGLGWAPEGFEAFGSAARRAGFHTADLLAVGLVKEAKKQGREPYDAFRGRIIFPIEDLGGRVLAFGGRVLGPVEEHVPKYLNSPESPVYHKGRTLYGLGWSRGAIRKEEVALVVEGYMDYVSLAAHGVGNAVAPLGTAMTDEQATLIRQYAPRAILLYDSDKAGLKATFRNGDQLLRAGMEVLVATLPEGEDPDSLVRAQGEKALRRYLDDAIDVLERKLLLLDRKNFFSSIKGTRRAIDYLLPTVRAAADPVLRGVYLKRVSDRTGVPVETLDREVAQQDAAAAPAREAERRREWERREQQREMRRASPALRLRMGAEKNLLMMMFQSEHWIEEAMKFIGPDDFEDADYRRLFRVLVDTEGRRDAEGRWLLEFPEELNADVEAIRQDAAHHDWTGAPAYFAENMDHILARPVERRFRAVKHREVHGPEDEARVLAEMLDLHSMKRAGQAKGAKPGVLDPSDPFLRRERR